MVALLLLKNKNFKFYNSMKTSILNINEDILISVLSKWTELVDVARLDSAVCVQRDLFLSVIKDDRMSSFETKNCRPYMILSLYTWLFLREVKFRNILIWGHISSRLFEIIPSYEFNSYTSLFLLCLRHINLTERIVNFIGSCSQLTDLTFEHCSIEVLFGLVQPVVWQALTKLSYSGVSKEASLNVFLDFLCEHCRLLTSLELVSNSLNETSLKALIKSNPSLTEISLGGDGVNQSFVDFLIQNCKNMTKLSLYSRSLLSVESLCQLLEKVVSVSAVCVNLEFFDMLNWYQFGFNLSDPVDFRRSCFCNEDGFLLYCETFLNFDKPYLDCTGDFKLLFDRHFLSPFALFVNLTHVKVDWKFMNNESLLKMLQALKKLISLSVDIGDSQEYPNLLSAPFVDHHTLKVIKIIRKGRSNVWITMNLGG